LGFAASIAVRVDSTAVMKLHVPVFQIAEMFLTSEVQKMEKMQKNQPAATR
jgi:hypothetical protein